MIEFLQNHLTDIMAIVSAMIAVVTTILSLRVTSKGLQYLNKAKERETYIVCPHCKKHVLLSEMDFHLPGGALDQNLNGVPDDEEIENPIL